MVLRQCALCDLLPLGKCETEVDQEDSRRHEIDHYVLKDEVERNIDSILKSAIMNDYVEFVSFVDEPDVVEDSEYS